MDNRRILEGLGELLIPRQKDWARAKLREETIALLKLKMKEMNLPALTALLKASIAQIQQ